MCVRIHMCVFMDGSGNLRQGPPSERLHIICLSKACVREGPGVCAAGVLIT